ncbi:MAG: hypothetical protein H0U85_10360 [Gemmatimonadales bacterium]|nr:hypothetical protein [Gemmatimonadales bacterium]
MRWVIETATGRFLRGGLALDPQPADPATQEVVDVPGDEPIDMETERYDATLAPKRRSATEAEMQVADAAVGAERAAVVVVADPVVRATVRWVLARVLAATPTEGQVAGGMAEWQALFAASVAAVAASSRED